MNWIRRHPFRAAVYLLLAAGVAAGTLLAYCVASGRANGLLTRAARSERVRKSVQARFEVAYSVGSVRVVRASDCERGIEVTGFAASLLAPRAGRVRGDRLFVCWPGRVQLEGFEAGREQQPSLLSLAAARVELSREAAARGIRVTDDAGLPLLAVEEVSAALPGLDSRMTGIALHSETGEVPARVDSAGAEGVRLAAGSVTLKRSSTTGVKLTLARVVDEKWNLEAEAARLEGVVRAGLETARASLAAVHRMVERARSLLWWGAVLACLLVLAAKLIVTRAPIVWRLAAAGAPVALCLVVAAIFVPRASWLTAAVVAVILAAALAFLLWWRLYRRNDEWHQRWEPVALDVVAPLIILPPLILRAIPAPLPPELRVPSTVSVESADVRDTQVALQLGECSAARAEAAVPKLTARGVKLNLDPAGAGLRSIELETAEMEGETRTNALELLGPVQYLPASWKRAPLVRFCAQVEGRRGQSSVPQPVCELAAAPRTLTLQLGAAVDIPARSADVIGLLRTPVVAVGFAGQASERGIRLDQLRSLAGSQVRLGSGSAEIEWSGPVAARAKVAGIELSRDNLNLAVDSAGIAARVPQLCRSGRVELRVDSGPARVSGGEGLAASVSGATVEVDRPDAASLSSRVKLAEPRIEARRVSDTEPWLSLDASAVDVNLGARTSSELFPRALRADAQISVARAGGTPAVRVTPSLQLIADLWTGEWRLGEQELVVEQSITERVPPVLRMNLSAGGRVLSVGPSLSATWDAKLHIPELSPLADPLTVQLRDILLTASGSLPAASLEFALETGRSRIAIPGMPRHFSLREIGSLRLRTQGRASPLPDFESLENDWSLIQEWAGNRLRAPQTEIEFQLVAKGTPEDGVNLSLTTPSGASVAVDRLTTRIGRLALPDVRLRTVEVQTHAVGIRTPLGGDLELASTTSLADRRTEVSLREPVAGTLVSEPGRVNFKLSKELELEPLQRRGAPLLKQAGVDLEGIRLGGRLSALDAGLRFEGGQLAALDFDASLAPGPLATLDFERMYAPATPGYLRTLEVSSTAPLRIHGSMPARELAFSAAGLSLAGNQGQVRTSAAVEGSVILDWHDSARDNPLVQRLSEAASGLRSHIAKAQDAFGAEGQDPEGSASRGGSLLSAENGVETRTGTSAQINSPASSQPAGAPPGADAELVFDLDVQGDAQPALRLSDQRIDAALRSEIRHLEWRPGGAGSWAAKGALGVKAAAGVHEDHLVIDAVAPLDLAITRDGSTVWREKLQLPLLLAARSSLRPDGDPESGNLWDTGYYDRFWQDHPPVHAAPSGPLFERSTLSLGPLSARGISIPGDPLRIALGYGPQLEVDLPFAARVAYGEAGGRLQGRLQWADSGAVLDGTARVSIEHWQAGALGLAGPFGHVALLEDTLSGLATARVRGFHAGRNLIAILFTDASRVIALDQVDFGLNLASVREEQGGAGILQFSTQLRLRPYNELLRKIVEGVRIDSPPQGLRYADMAFQFAVKDGLVETGVPLLALRGVQIEGMTLAHAGADINVRWGYSQEEKVRLRNLIYMLQRSLAQRAEGGLQW